MSSHDGGDEPPRKRVRKGTKSCWECKRRKVRCQLSSEDVPICSGCLTRGTTCLSQEYPEERDSSSGTHVGERLGRIEQILETIVTKMAQYEEDENSQKILTPNSVGNDLTPYTTSNGRSDSTAVETVPFLSLFDSPVLGRRDQSQAATPVSHQGRAKTCVVPKIDRIRNALVELLPTQREMNMISESSSCWLLVHAMTPKGTESMLPATFDIAAVAKEHPARIAKTVLHIAVCLQQLDAEFDRSQLKFLPSIEARTEAYISRVQSLITSDDDLVCSLDGIQCLTLQGLFHINAGNPRRAWLSFRRAVTISQLMGIHKNDSTIPGGREVWHRVVQGDRYMSLVLGHPAACDDIGFLPEETYDNPAMDKYALFSRELCDLSGAIIKRNMSGNTQGYATTQEIAESLERLHQRMPPSWWEIPEVYPEKKTESAAVVFDRLMAQIWFYQNEALTHLPYMLRASTERKYEYSRISCLQSSREIMWRYLCLRSIENRSICCKVIDFGALTAAVTLFLGLMGVTGRETPEHKRQEDEDRKLVNAVLESMEKLAAGNHDIVAVQSVNVIKSLLAIEDGSEGGSGNLKLTIPYFGTITIVRPPQAPATPMSLPTPTNQNHNQNQNQNAAMPYMPHQNSQQLSASGNVDQQVSWDGVSYSHTTPSSFISSSTHPLISFQSSQFPPVAPEQTVLEDWGLPQDNYFFEGLLNTDIEGNWIY